MVAEQLTELGPWLGLPENPTDALLAFVSPRLWPRYLAGRLAILALVAALSAAGVIAQPLVAVCAFAALPLGAGYIFVRARKPRLSSPATAA